MHPIIHFSQVSVDRNTMHITPVNFGVEGKNMLSHLLAFVSKNYLGMPEQYDKVITSLRTAYSKELTLDKEQTSYDDLLDVIRLNLK